MFYNNKPAYFRVLIAYNLAVFIRKTDKTVTDKKSEQQVNKNDLAASWDLLLIYSLDTISITALCNPLEKIVQFYAIETGQRLLWRFAVYDTS